MQARQPATILKATAYACIVLAAAAVAAAGFAYLRAISNSDAPSKPPVLPTAPFYGYLSGVINVKFADGTEPAAAYNTLQSHGFTQADFAPGLGYQQKYHYYVYLASGNFADAMAGFLSSPLFEKPEILYKYRPADHTFDMTQPYAISVDSSFASTSRNLATFFSQHPAFVLKPVDPALAATVPDPNPEVFQMFVPLKIKSGSEDSWCQQFAKDLTVASCHKVKADGPAY